MRLPSIALTFALVAPSLTAQTTLYVDVNGTPPGTGTQDDPYTSLQNAVNHAAGVPGDLILVAPGTYVGNVLIGCQAGGSEVRSLAGPRLTRIAGHVQLGQECGAPRLDGFTISSVSMASATLRRCIVEATGVIQDRGVFYEDNSIIEHCVITGFDQALLMFAFATVPAQVRNTICFANGAVNHQNNIIHFDHCALPSLSMPFQGTQVGTVVGDPGFWNAAAGDFRLRPDSICIDAGSPSSPLDPDGSIADIGALPFDPFEVLPPVVYCSSELNGEGCMATVSTSGTCSASSASPFVISATQVTSNKTGRMLYSLAPANIPFDGGTLCLGGPIRRTAAMNSGTNGNPCSGVLSFDFNERIQSGDDPALVVGTIAYAQFRYRDPQDPLGFGAGWTDAVRFVIAP